jgi:tetratricopeptide (TPR) repeat protein
MAGRFDATIDTLKKELRLQPPGHGRRARTLNSLATLTRKRWKQTGDLDCLEDAIQYAKEALDWRPSGHPERARTLNGLSASLHARWRVTGEIASLDHAILFQEEALDLEPPGHPNRAWALNSLATSLHSRWEVTGDKEVLKEAIRLIQEALDLQPSGHPRRAWTLSSLSRSLHELWKATGEKGLLDDAIDLHEEAIRAPSVTDLERAWSLNVLGIIWHDHWALHRDAASLERAIQLKEEAIELYPPGHPDFARASRNLAKSLGAQFVQTGAAYHLEEAIEYLTKAASDPHANPRLLLTSVLKDLSWIQGMTLSSRASERLIAPLLRAYEALVRLLPRVAYLGLDPTARLSELTGAEGLGLSAANVALQSYKPEAALELLEEARAVFWSQALCLRSPLDDLPKEDAVKLSEIFRILNDVSKQSRDSSNAASTLPAWDDPTVILRRRKSVEAEQLIEQIRRRPGLERFMLSQPYSVLSQAASCGIVVVLLAHKQRCVALAITGAAAEVQRIALPGVDLEALRLLSEQVKSTSVRHRNCLIPMEGSHEVCNRVSAQLTGHISYMMFIAE